MTAPQKPVIPSKKFLNMFGPDDPPTPPVPPVPPTAPMYTAEQLNAAALLARKEEKDKLYKDLEKKKKEAKDLEDTLAAKDKELADLKLNSLPANDQVKTQLANIEKQLAEQTVRAQQAEARAQQEALERYRSDAISYHVQQGDQMITELVQGSTPEEINASILIAKAEHQRITQEHVKRLTDAGYVITKGAPAAAPGQPVTPSPHFVPPVAAGFPTVIQGQPTVEQAIDMQQLTDLTSEESVRNGTYAKVRQQLRSGMKVASAGSPMVPLGFNPRFVAPPQALPPSSPQSLPFPQTHSPPPPLPTQQPAGVPPLPPTAVNNLTPAQLAQMAADIRARGAPTSGAAPAFADRFKNTPPIKPG